MNIDEAVAALGKALADDNEDEGFKAMLALLAGALTDLRRLADAAEAIAKNVASIVPRI